MKVARRSGIAPFIAMEVMKAANERAQTGAEVLHMEVGQPDTGAPAAALAAARAALEGPSAALGYTEALGVPGLRARIARHYLDKYGVAVAPERIAVTTGSSGAFLLAFLAAFDAGDRVAILEPGYPAYRNILTALGIEVVPIPVGPDTGFQATPEHLAAAGRLDGFLVASPANPTGSMLGADELDALLRWCDGAGVRFLSDEIYHGITYGKRETTALGRGKDQAIVINSFSKYFCMTGWRLGWLVLPQDLVRPVERLAQNLFISPPALPQLAAQAAFDAMPELDANVARYAASRALLLRELPQAGFESFAPADGAFYLFADVARLTNDSTEFCRRMLAEAGVAATPGTDFDPVRGNRFVRFSFAGTTADMARAAAKLQAWLKPRHV
jgi:aspartate/methionine/tyrosine aminotransferase